MADRLPGGWTGAEVRDLLREPLINGRSVKTAAEGFPVLRLTALRDGRIDLSERKTGAWTEASASPYLVSKGDYFVARGNGSIRLVGRGGLLTQEPDPVAFPDTLVRMRFLEEAVWPRYFALVWDSLAVRSQIERKAKTTAGIHKINQRDIESCNVPLPPLREQREIASAAESYLTRLDNAVATVERVQRNLTRYRTSVLKAAVEGRLVPTEAELARTEGRSYEPASVLLDRILTARRQRWEEDQRGRVAANRVPTDDRWREDYRQPEPPQELDSPVLPEGWCWASIEQLGEVSGGITKNSRRDQLPLQLPYLRVANVYADELRLDDVTAIGVSEAEVERAKLESGDLLVVEGNGSIDQIGRVAVWDASIRPCLHQNHLIKVRFPSAAFAEWCLSWLLSPDGRTTIQRVASSTSGLHTLSISKVEQLPVPLPPLAEQIRITQEIERLSTVQKRTLGEIADQAARCQRLRQSILNWAFEGRLVEQDPNDEPASVLLERIKAERASAAAAEKTKPRRAKRQAAKPAKTA